MEHNYKYKAYDWQKGIYYTELVKDPVLKKRLESEAAKKTTHITDERIAGLIKKREAMLIAKVHFYYVLVTAGEDLPFLWRGGASRLLWAGKHRANNELGWLASYKIGTSGPLQRTY